MSKIQKKPLYRLTFCAVLVAVSLALSYLKIPTGGFGGSVDFVMVPLFIICYIQGAAYGIISGAVFGILKCIVGGGLSWAGLVGNLLDYVLAYAAVGVAGFFRLKRPYVGLATLLGCIARFAVHFVSGITLYAKYALDNYEGIATPTVWLYSLVYNGFYMLPNTVIAVAVMALLVPVLRRIERM